MASPKTFTPKQGFTLIEIVVVLGLLSIVGGLSLLMSMESFRGSTFRNEQDIIVSALRRARSQAINNMCIGDSSVCTDGKPHGVHIEDGKYTIFQGQTYNAADSTNEVLQAFNKNVHIAMSNDVIFSPLSGAAISTNSDTNIIDSAGNIDTITVNAEGRIEY